MTRLFKYCEQQYNVAKGCQTLQLGTLKYYQNLEFPKNPAADPTECKRRMVGGSGLYSSSDLSLLADGRVIANAPQRVLNNLIISSEVHNCYIFSCSLKPFKGDVFQGCDSCYSFTQINVFADYLRVLLASNFNNADLERHQEHLSETFIILSEHGKVVYLDEDAFHFNPDSVYKVKMKDKRYDIRFTKPKEYKGKKYKLENEYRFCFSVIDVNNNQILVREQPKIIQIPSLLSNSPLSNMCSLFNYEDYRLGVCVV